MIFSNQLGAKQILRAAQWYQDHKTHVDELVKTVSIAYPPTDNEDKANPALWKAAHWKWFLENR